MTLLSEVGATPYGGRWWRRSDAGAIEIYDEEKHRWLVWEGSLFDAYPPIELFEEDDGFEDAVPQLAQVSSLNVLRIFTALFAIAAASELVAIILLAVDQTAPSGSFFQGSPEDFNWIRTLQVAQTIASAIWQVSAGVIVITTCFVAYRYMQRRSE